MRAACERRELLGSSMLTAGGLALTIAKADERYAATPAPLSGSCAAPNASPPITYILFDTVEAASVEATVAWLIPADDQWPGALAAGALNYLNIYTEADRIHLGPTATPLSIDSKTRTLLSVV